MRWIRIWSSSVSKRVTEERALPSGGFGNARTRAVSPVRGEFLFENHVGWVLEATSAFFFDRPRPEGVRLHLVRDEVLLVA